MPSSSLHFVYALSTLRASTWDDLPCWVKNWCWCVLATRMNSYKSNSVPSVFATSCSHTQQALLHWAATWTTSQSTSSVLSGFAEFLKEQLLVCFQQRNAVSGFTNTKITGLLRNTAHFHCRACVPWTLNRKRQGWKWKDPAWQIHKYVAVLYEQETLVSEKGGVGVRLCWLSTGLVPLPSFGGRSFEVTYSKWLGWILPRFRAGMQKQY